MFYFFISMKSKGLKTLGESWWNNTFSSGTKQARAERICVCLCLHWQIRNSNATHLCVDQGVKENHTATLHPCHGWNPQVESQL